MIDATGPSSSPSLLGVLVVLPCSRRPATLDGRPYTSAQVGTDAVRIAVSFAVNPRRTTGASRFRPSRRVRCSTAGTSASAPELTGVVTLLSTGEILKLRWSSRSECDVGAAVWPIACATEKIRWLADAGGYRPASGLRAAACRASTTAVGDSDASESPWRWTIFHSPSSRRKTVVTRSV